MTDPPDSAWHFVAGSDDAGTRLDRFLAQRIGTLSRTRVKSLVAGVLAGTRYTLQAPPAQPASPMAQAIALDILFEDADLLVLDKPAGLVVHPAPGNPDGTLVNALLAHCGDTLPGIGGEKRPGIVHRLDKDTSGVMVVAKSETAMAALGQAFATRDLERSYTALCWGVPAPSQGAFTGAIGRDPRDRKRMAVVARGGKAAQTGYRLQRSWQGAVGLVACRLATGRTHQIRVHMATAGHPIVGDPTYLRRVPAAAKALAAGPRQALLDFPRQALHAASLGFRHPRTGEPLHFETGLPRDFAALIDRLDAAAMPQLPEKA